MTPFTQALSGALVDFIWQGAVIGLLLWMALPALHRHSAATRYAVCCAALLALVMLPLLTVTTLWTAAASSSIPVTVGANPGGSRAVASTAMSQTLLTFWLEPQRPRIAWLAFVQQWALPVWSIGVLLLSARLAYGWTQVFNLRRSSPVAEDTVAATVMRLAARIGVRRPVRVLVASLAEGPSVIGWLRPVILLPPAAAMGLTPQQLEAVLAHELAHVTRHDYLVNLVQVLVETLFFYHPVVWWVSRRIRHERELCCDDVAVRSCGDPVGYARALTILARRRLEAPEFATAATGGPLLYRVRRLLALTPNEHVPSRVPAAMGAAVVVTCALLNVDWLQAQTAEQPRFDVISIKRNMRDDGLILNSYRNGRLTASGVTLASLIRSAYQVQELQVVGQPEWMNRDRFDVTAVSQTDDRSAPPATAGEPPRQQLMLRSLLADRFGLKVRKETRDMPVYALVVARKDGALGPQLRRSPVDCAALFGASQRGEARPPAEGMPQCSTSVAPGRITGRSRTLPQFATALSMLANTGSSLNRLVVDRTGLEGNFDVDLTFTPDNLPPVGPGGPRPAMPSIDPNGPSLFAALQEQLGLKLESQRGPVEVLVIETVHQPTED
jgi:uncharacterized protein (TIGR03435 family)